MNSPYQPLAWWQERIRLAGAHALTRGDPNVIVGVIDSGIGRHPELVGRVVTGYDFVTNSGNGDGDGRDSDASEPANVPRPPGHWHFHGTATASVIVGRGERGPVGVAPRCRVQPLRVNGANGTDPADVIAAIRWGAGLEVGTLPVNPWKGRVKVLMANVDFWGLDGTTQRAFEDAVTAATQAGVTFVSSANNQAEDITGAHYPATTADSICVASLGYTGAPASYSNFGAAVDICAHGGEEKRLLPSGYPGAVVVGHCAPDGRPEYAFAEGGTSWATPQVAGVAALLYAVRPGITPAEVRAAILSSATPHQPSVLAGRYGAGVLNAEAAVKAALALA